MCISCTLLFHILYRLTICGTGGLFWAPYDRIPIIWMIRITLILHPVSSSIIIQVGHSTGYGRPSEAGSSVHLTLAGWTHCLRVMDDLACTGTCQFRTINAGTSGTTTGYIYGYLASLGTHRLHTHCNKVVIKILQKPQKLAFPTLYHPVGLGIHSSEFKQKKACT